MLELVNVKARTRGKSPQLFEYNGVGRLTEREVLSGEKEQKVGEDGKPVFEEDGKTPVLVAGTIKDENGKPLVVHDIDATGIVDASAEGALDEVIALFSSVSSEKAPLQRIVDGALNWFNVLQRKAASPVVEVDKDDELSPIIAEMVAYGILKAEDVPVFRRNVTSGAGMTEQPKLEYIKLLKHWKQLQAAKAA